MPEPCARLVVLLSVERDDPEAAERFGEPAAVVELLVERAARVKVPPRPVIVAQIERQVTSRIVRRRP